MKKIPFIFALAGTSVVLAALTGCSGQSNHVRDYTDATAATAKAAPAPDRLKYEKVSELPNYAGTLYTFTRKDSSGVTATCYFIKSSGASGSGTISCYPVRNADGQPTQTFESPADTPVPAK